MKSKLINILLTVIFLTGLSLLLYPTVSNYYNSYLQSKAIALYADNVENLDQEKNKTILEEARLYNAQLSALPSQFQRPEEMKEAYWHQLMDFSGQVMAYVEIPSIGVTLPIMHGTSDEVLDKAIGHLEWTSLPVGGESTHSVISGHRGLPSSELFTNIDHLEVGDPFYIHVMGQTLEYWVDNIAVVLPEEMDLLTIVRGQDYCTLLTCTPYGINSHRLLVRGIRMADREVQESEMLPITNEVTGIDMMVLIPVALVALSIVVFAFLVLQSGKKRKGGGKNDRNK